MLFEKASTLSIYRRNAKLINEDLNALCYSHHIFRSMKKVAELLVKTPKNLYVKRKKDIH